ncbi:MAG TPA: T9SS type A sorting domain-containing protein [Bacteroidia bacterium]
MKNKITLCMAAACLLALKTINAQIDLVPGINYSYNPPGSNCIITGITVDVCNNDNGNASAFDVSMYLYDTPSQNYWIIGTQRLNNGLSGNSCITISNWDIDISQTPNIPNGTYRLGIWVDSGQEISETDENNNAGLLSGNINYSCGSAGVHDASAFVQNISNSPNPFSESTKINYTLLQDSKVTLEIFDVCGKKITTLENEKKQAGNYIIEWNAAGLEAGTYFLKVGVNDVWETKKLTLVK